MDVLFPLKNKKQVKQKTKTALKPLCKTREQLGKKGDSTAVLEKISPNIVLYLPEQTAQPIVGKKAVQ